MVFKNLDAPACRANISKCGISLFYMLPNVVSAGSALVAFACNRLPEMQQKTYQRCLKEKLIVLSNLFRGLGTQKAPQDRAFTGLSNCLERASRTD
jgi:hypothetical protein